MLKSIGQFSLFPFAFSLGTDAFLANG